MIEIDEDLMKELASAILGLSDRRTNKAMNTANTEFYSDGLVTEINATTSPTSAKVSLSFTETDFIPNLTGKGLEEGNKVRVFYNTKSFTDAYIGVNFNEKGAE